MDKTASEGSAAPDVSSGSAEPVGLDTSSTWPSKTTESSGETGSEAPSQDSASASASTGSSDGGEQANPVKSPDSTKAPSAVDEEPDMIESGTYVIASKKDPYKMLDMASASTSNGGNAQLYDSNGTDAQCWRIRSAGDGWYTLTPCNSALRLDIANGSGSSGVNVQQWSGDGSKVQRWRFSMGEKGVQIVSALGTVPDAWGASSESGTNVVAYKYNGTAVQAWRFVAAATPSMIGYQNDSRFFQVSSWERVGFGLRNLWLCNAFAYRD